MMDVLLLARQQSFIDILKYMLKTKNKEWNRPDHMKDVDIWVENYIEDLYHWKKVETDFSVKYNRI